MSLLEIADQARELLDDAVALRRRLHRRPEIGLALPATQEAVLEALEPLDLDVRRGARTSSVVAVLDGALPGPTVLLRGDMDALPLPEDTGLDFASGIPGAMHACGHDAHTAMLAGAARLLAARRASFSGRVVFMFQPGEEGHHGARVMIEEGLLDEWSPSAAFAIHTTPTIAAGAIATRPGPIMASDDIFVAKIRGRGGHASMPHDALDPVPIACSIVQSIQSFVTRRIDAFDPAVITVTRIDAGTAFNVIPETVRLCGTMRSVSARTRTQVRDELRRLIETLAAAHGAEAEVTLHEGYPVTVNDPDMAGFASRIATELVGADAVRPLRSPVMGAEDFSYVLERVPGAMVLLGTRPEGGGHIAPNHSNRMRLNEAAMATGIALHASVALRFLGAGV
jgi:amidohydrolase